MKRKDRNLKKVQPENVGAVERERERELHFMQRVSELNNHAQII